MHLVRHAATISIMLCLPNIVKNISLQEHPVCVMKQTERVT